MMGITKTTGESSGRPIQFPYADRGHLALDCASKGVRVNAVCPPWVRTPNG